MIKAIIFDLDGVLVDTKDIHFTALNNAIEKVCKIKKTISYDKHLKIYDGLPTKKKLEIFFNKKISKNKIDKINSVKQIQTTKLLKSKIKFNKTIFDILKNFNKKKNHYLCSKQCSKKNCKNMS